MRSFFEKRRTENLINNAKNYLSVRDYPAAIALYEQAIAKGNASAMNNRGDMHYYGQGGSVDYPAAIALYEQAIVKGNASAMNNRGYMHHYGQGGPVDYPAAIALYEQAIAKGNASAMNNRGDMHYYGQGGSVDYPAAIVLYEQAIAKGNASVMNNRANMHHYGQGGPVDYPAAIALYQQAIAKGNASAVNSLASILDEQVMAIENVHAVGAIYQDYRENRPNMLLMLQNDRQQHDGHNDLAIEVLTKKALNLVLKYTSVQKPENLNPNNWINYWFKKTISPQNISEFMKRTLGELEVVYDVEDASARIELCLPWICESKTFQEFLEQEKLSTYDKVRRLNNDLTNVQVQKDSLLSEELVCPITQEVMRNPVIIESGICYEHAEILNWLKQKSICPKTNQIVNKNIIIKEVLLKSFCDRYWEFAPNCEKIHQEIDINNKELDLLNNFKEEATLAYEGADVAYGEKNDAVGQKKSVSRMK
jgi:TPR repeat protein